MYRFVLISELFLASFGSTFSQKPTLEWVARYQNYFSAAHSLSADNLGNIFVSGYHIPVNRSKFLTLKFNLQGELQWERFYQGPDTITTGSINVAYKNIADGNGNVYVAGRSSNYLNNNGEDILIIKYDTSGDSIWTARYNGPAQGPDLYADMVIDKFGNVYVAGTDFNADFVALKYDSAGTLLWNANYNDPSGPAQATAMAIDSSGNVYVTGYSLFTNFNKYTTVKFNQAGVQQWARDYSTNSDAEAYSIAVDIQTNVYITGLVDSSSISNHSKYRTIKYDTDGNELWAADFKSIYYWMDIPFKIMVDISSNVYAVGTSLVKYDRNGNFQWADTVSPGWYASFDKEYNLYLTGGLADTSQFERIQTVKYNIYGDKLWTLNYGGREDTLYSSSDIFVDNSLNVFVLGSVYSELQKSDSIIVLKYSQPIGIISNNNQIPGKFELYQNYPNPFNPRTLIKYDIAKNGFVKVVIFDLLGRVVKELVNSFKSAGSYSVEFDGTNIASGVYIYRMESGNFIDFRKMVLIK